MKQVKTYSLYRALTKAGYFCQIIAPSPIPRQPGMKQKTDKIDAKKLSEYYSKDLLHVIAIPDETDEAVRDLLRSKLFVKSTLTKVKNHTLAMCRRQE